MNKTVAKFFLNESGEVSLSKVGSLMLTASSIVLMVPTMNLDVIHVPAAILDLAKIAAAIGGGTAAIGFRDAVTKGKK
jgi:hypothetical protein